MTGLLPHLRRLALLGLMGCSGLRCTEAIQVGLDFGVGGGASGGSSNGGGPAAPDAAQSDAAVPSRVPCERIACGPTYYQCGDCEDDDGDGRIDAADPECLGPCDDNESELDVGEAAVRGNCQMDCYFDRNAGFGSGCSGSFRCDPLSVAPDFPPSGLAMCSHDPTRSECGNDAPQTAACQTSCLPLTPNGCDCFGCCELPPRSGTFVWLGSESLASCTQVEDCRNACDACELCVGDPMLPAGCGTGGENLPACPGSSRPCDPNAGLGCGPIEFCITGCCIPLPR